MKPQGDLRTQSTLCSMEVSARHTNRKAKTMHTTVQQNKAHRTDQAWKKIAASHTFAGRNFNSGYATTSGWSIRKGWEMTGSDWHIFNADGEHMGRAHSLTWAKLDAAQLGA